MSKNAKLHLPVSMEECQQRGWQAVDIVLITGDAYIDHPSFGVAIIGRLLESRGFRVAILSQPRCNTTEDFLCFGKPRLFFGITAGNLDSIVANYTGNGKVRDFDAYSPNGNPWRSEEQSKANRRRPDRATIVYANLAREAFGDVPIVLGGVEASLRRFIHFDYKQNRLRGSVLVDAKADLLVYGMGEKAIICAANALRQGDQPVNIQGTCERMTDRDFDDLQKSHNPESIVYLPSWDEIQKDSSRFMDAEKLIDKHARHNSSKILVQRQRSGWVIQHPAADILNEEELDQLYDLPFQRTPHPAAEEIPAYQMIRHSVTIVRGCSGNCSFCAITRHQGAEVVSRSQTSILKEVAKIATMTDFSGTITDLGGPTANLFGSSCNIGGCKKRDCLYPKVCEHLQANEEKMISLLETVAAIQGVKHVFISSGLRMELLLKTPRLMEKLLQSHTPGSLKIAPEHTEADVLRLMHKESYQVLRQFVNACKIIAANQHKNLPLTPYIITGHPGSSVDHTRSLVKSVQNLGLTIRQFQDFTPTPGTLSTAMFVSGTDMAKRKIPIPSPAQRSEQRKIIEAAFHKRRIKRHRMKKR